MVFQQLEKHFAGKSSLLCENLTKEKTGDFSSSNTKATT